MRNMTVFLCLDLSDDYGRIGNYPFVGQTKTNSFCIRAVCTKINKGTVLSNSLYIWSAKHLFFYFYKIYKYETNIFENYFLIMYFNIIFSYYSDNITTKFAQIIHYQIINDYNFNFTDKYNYESSYIRLLSDKI